MLETRTMTAKCEKCDSLNDIPLKYFLGFEYEFEKAVIATCQDCNTDFVAQLNDSLIR